MKNWITFNEPWVFSRAGYDVGKKAPGRCSPYIKEYGPLCEDGRSGFEAYQVSHNLLLAHAYSVQAFRACKQVYLKLHDSHLLFLTKHISININLIFFLSNL